MQLFYIQFSLYVRVILWMLNPTSSLKRHLIENLNEKKAPKILWIFSGIFIFSFLVLIVLLPVIICLSQEHIHWQMLKAPPLISSDLHWSVFQNRPNRRALICSKKLNYYSVKTNSVLPTINVSVTYLRIQQYPVK